MIIDLCCIYSKTPQNYLAVSNINITLVYSLLYALLFFVAVLCLHISKIWNSVKKKKPFDLKKKNHPPFCSRKQIACSWELSHQEFSRSRYTSIILMFLLMFPNNVLWNQNHFLSFSYTSDALHHISDQKWGVIPQTPARKS